MSKTVKACASKRPRDAGDGWEERVSTTTSTREYRQFTVAAHTTRQAEAHSATQVVAMAANNVTSDAIQKEPYKYNPIR